MRFYLYRFVTGSIELYGQNKKGYGFFHVGLHGSELKFDKPRIRYELTDYGWTEISAAQAAEVLRDMLGPVLSYRWLFNYEKIKLEEIRQKIEEAR